MMTTQEICDRAEGLVLEAGDGNDQIKAAVALIGIGVRVLIHYGGAAPTMDILTQHARNLERLAFESATHDQAGHA